MGDFPRWKVISIWVFLAALIALAVPSFVPESVTATWPRWIPQPRINYGLDLAGGSYLLLEADTNDLANSRIEAMRDQVQTALSRATPHIDTGDISTANGHVSFMVRDPAQVDAARQALLPIIGSGAGLSGQREWDLAVVDTSRIVLTPTPAYLAQSIHDAMDSATDVVRRRIDALGTREPTIVRSGDTRIVVQVPGLQNPQALKELLGHTARLEFKLVDTNADPTLVAAGQAPIGDQLLPYPSGAGLPNVSLPANGRPPMIAVRRSAIITGDQLVAASAETNQQQGGWAVGIRFNSEGGRRFAQVTQQNVNHPFAIIIDNSVISAPNINEPILGGSASISGNFTADSANQLAIQLRSGALPVALHVIDERTVSADLGNDSIHAGILASIIAVVAVIAFMLVTYGRFGVYANLAVIINVLVIIGVLALIGGTLTLPRHRRLRADDRHRSRRQRADQRAHPRGAPSRTQRPPVGRARLQGSEPHDSGGELHARDLGRHHVPARLGAGQGIRGRAADRHRDLGIHRGRLHPHAGDAMAQRQAPCRNPHLGGSDTPCACSRSFPTTPTSALSACATGRSG